MGDDLTVAVIVPCLLSGEGGPEASHGLPDHIGNRYDAGLHVAIMEFLALGMNRQDAFAMMLAVHSAAFYLVLRLLWRHKPRD